MGYTTYAKPNLHDSPVTRERLFFCSTIFSKYCSPSMHPLVFLTLSSFTPYHSLGCRPQRRSGAARG